MIREAAICPACCGDIRDPQQCTGCSFYKPPRRDYNAVERYTAADMSRSEGLRGLAYSVEWAACRLDDQRGNTLRDAEAITFFELLLDKYAFEDPRATLTERARTLDCEEVFDKVTRDLQGRSSRQVAKVVAVVRRTAQRRDSGGRVHLKFLHTAVDGAGAR